MGRIVKLNDQLLSKVRIDATTGKSSNNDRLGHPFTSSISETTLKLPDRLRVRTMS